MAAQSVGTINQQHWEEVLSSLITLSNATVKRNLELENRVAELELELSVWKQAHSVTERDAKVHNTASLSKQITHPNGFRGSGYPLVLCVLNGQKLFFNNSLLIQGFIGGQTAAQHLTKTVSDYLSSEGIQIFGRLSFWVTIYFNKVDLINALVGNVCSREQFEGFLAGFSQTSPRFTTVDVGIGQEETDVKIREYIQTFARLPDTLRVFLGGCCESNPFYSNIFNHLLSEELLGKLVTVRSVSEDWMDQTYPIPVLSVDRLLMQLQRQCSPLSPQQLTPLSVASLDPNGGLVSPQSPSEGARYINPKYPLHKQAPPPCNEHYLMSCSKGAKACKYSHDYMLTPEQLAVLAANAKKAPCNWLKNGLRCPYGDACCWGHVCPNGQGCYHLSRGKCWFKGEEMHNA